MASTLTDLCVLSRRFRRLPERMVPEVPRWCFLAGMPMRAHPPVTRTGYPPERGDTPTVSYKTLTARARERADPPGEFS